jgi:hypothetical protein
LCTIFQLIMVRTRWNSAYSLLDQLG